MPVEKTIFDRLNAETRESRSKEVDRFNQSTRGNYNSYNPQRQDWLNNRTYKENNGDYSRKYFW